MPNQVEHGECVVGAEAIVRDIGGGAVRRCDDLVGILADGHAGDHLERGWVDDAERVVVLGEDEQRGAGRGLAEEDAA